MIVVQKYGGTSVGDVDRMKRVAARIVETRRAGHDVVAVVSAMGKTTDELVDMAARINTRPPQRELDILLTAGERISMALLAMAIEDLGVRARSFTGSQAGIITDTVHGKARILAVTPERVREALDDGNVVIVAGFQGVSRDTKDITTLGRGGSDTTAVALAAALEADACEIYTDVDGVYTADPRIVAGARKLDRLAYEEMLELAAQGAKVRSARSSSGATTACASTYGRRSTAARGPGLSPRRTWWRTRSSPGSPTTRRRPRSPSSACPTGPASPRACSPRSPTRTSTST